MVILFWEKFAFLGKHSHFRTNLSIWDFFRRQLNLRHRNLALPQSNVISPLQWLTEYFRGGKTASGIAVDPENAISLPTVFNAITLISESFSQIPIAPHIKTTIVDPDKTVRHNDEILKSHFSYPLVARRPHPYISSANFKKVMFSWALKYDNAYALIGRDGAGKALSMLPVHPNRVMPKITDDRRLIYTIDGRDNYEYSDIFHIIGYTDSGIIGNSRIAIVKEAIGKALAAQKFGAHFFGKGINLSGFIETPKLLKNEDAVKRLKDSFVQKYGGQNGQFGVGLLEDGAKFTPMQTDPEKAQLNDTIKLDGLTVSQIFNIPLTMLKYLERGTYNNLEQLTIQFVTYTLMPWGVNWEQECWEKLLTEREKREDNIQYKYNFNGLLRGDTDARAKFYESLAKVGAYSPNRILELEDENGYEGGNVHVLSPGAQTIEQIKNATQNTNTQN